MIRFKIIPVFCFMASTKINSKPSTLCLIIYWPHFKPITPDYSKPWKALPDKKFTEYFDNVGLNLGICALHTRNYPHHCIFQSIPLLYIRLLRCVSLLHLYYYMLIIL